MARIRWHGTEFTATPIHDNGDGTWLMRSESHTARTVPGTEITVKQGEIVEMSSAEAPYPTEEHLAHLVKLETEMAKERETLPTVRELLKRARKDGTLPMQVVKT